MENIIFKWDIGDVIKMPLFGEDLINTTIIQRSLIDTGDVVVIEYETDLLNDGIKFTQEEVEKYN